MAMVTCIECGKEVSSEAKTCPHCGKKLKMDFFDKAKDQALSLSESAKISEKIGSAISSIKSDNESGGIKKLSKNKYVIGSVVTFFSIIALMIILRGHGAPSCNDSDVKALVLEIAGGEIRNILLNQAIISEIGTAPRVQGNPTYKDWNKMKSDDEKIKKVIELVDKQYVESNPKLTSIRINDKNDKAKKCKCVATVALSNGNTLPIDYTAQFTEDGQLYAEVSGLK
jgi:zinc-ribbon domain